MGYYLYFWAEDKEWDFGFSPIPSLDISFYGKRSKGVWGMVLTPGLPIGLAYEILNTLQLKAKEPVGSYKELIVFVKTILEPILLQKGVAAVPFEEISGSVVPGMEDNDYLEQVRQALDGRIFYPQEVLEALKSLGVPPAHNLKEIMQLMYLRGWCEIIPAVGVRDGRLTCLRCGQDKNLLEVECVHCGSEHCVVCEECGAMGEARYCLPLYGFPGNERRRKGPPLEAALDFPLTAAQRDAAAKITALTKDNSYNSGLVWAVTGAGKTEVSFGAIAEVLGGGGRVLFAIPRRDVVLELEPRLKKAFPGVDIRVLYGGSKDRFLRGQLVLATTHQVIRFYRSFDLVVLDEVDAFPYQGSSMLPYVLERATKPGGKTIYMTATPDRKLLQGAKKGQLQLITIPARHHGHPLPLPLLVQIKVDSSAKEKGQSFASLRPLAEYLHRSIEGEGAQVLVFVPTIPLAETTAKLIEDLLVEGGLERDLITDQALVRFSHSKDPKRDEKRKNFADGEYPVLVTTSIMERGITIPKCNVLVLFGEKEHIYHTQTLVQMAGRAGRSTRWPRGNVWFVGSRVTDSMKEARRQIAYMNELAKSGGYLRY